MDKLPVWFSEGLAVPHRNSSLCSVSGLATQRRVWMTFIQLPSPFFDHCLSDAKSLLPVVLFSSFNNRGHGRVALWKSASNHCRLFLRALQMNFVNCREARFFFFFFFCIESEITGKTRTLFRCVHDALCLMHNLWVWMCLYLGLLGDMWGSQEEHFHQRTTVSLTNDGTVHEKWRDCRLKKWKFNWEGKGR